MLRKFFSDESGAIAALIALAITAVGQTGQGLVALFQSLIQALTLS